MEFLNTFESILYFSKIVKINRTFMKKNFFEYFFINYLENLSYLKNGNKLQNSNKMSDISATSTVLGRKKSTKNMKNCSKTHFLLVFRRNIKIIEKLPIFFHKKVVFSAKNGNNARTSRWKSTQKCRFSPPILRLGEESKTCRFSPPGNKRIWTHYFQLWY